MEYLLNDKQNVVVEDNNAIQIRSLCAVAMNVSGFKVEEVADDYDVYYQPGNESARLLVAFVDSQEEVKALAEKTNATPYAPLADRSLAQATMREFGISLVPVVTEGGNLAAVWRAERLGVFGAKTEELKGKVKHNDEFLSCTHQDPLIAIFVTLAQAIGVGRSVFVEFDESGNGNLRYIAGENVPDIYDRLNVSIFHAPELEKYNIVNAPAEKQNKAISAAREQYQQVQKAKSVEDAAAAEVQQPANATDTDETNTAAAAGAVAAGVAGAATDAESAAADTGTADTTTSAANSDQGSAADNSEQNSVDNQGTQDETPANDVGQTQVAADNSDAPASTDQAGGTDAAAAATDSASTADNSATDNASATTE